MTPFAVIPTRDSHLEPCSPAGESLVIPTRDSHPSARPPIGGGGPGEWESRVVRSDADL
jgi:hypothetical protein